MEKKTEVQCKEDFSPENVLKVIRTINRVGMSTDAKDWKTLRSLFYDQIEIDFGDVKGSQMINADDLVSWSEQSYKNMQTQHMFTNHDVTIKGNKAEVITYGRALHKQRVSKGDDYWFIYNKYEHSLILTQYGWKVARLKMTPTFEQGSSTLIDQALEDNQLKV